MTLTETFEKNIKNLNSTQKKGIENCNKTLQNSIKDLNKEMEKFKTGLETVRSSVDDKLSVGIDGVAKQRKSLLKSTRALEDFVIVAQKEIDERFPFKETVTLDEVKYWNYEAFKEWLRNFSKFVNNIDKQRSVTDHTMGLDFALKKRPAYTPFDKIRDLRDDLRDLFQTDYSIVKIIEDLNSIVTETADFEDKITHKESDITLLKEKISNNNSVISDLKNKITVLENESELKKLRDAKVKFQEHELEIGHLINPYKKSFRLYTRIPGAASYIIASARSYEENTIDTFLNDANNNFQQLKDLITEMIAKADNIDLKANLVNRCRQLIERINSGKITILKDEYLTFKENVAKLSENKTIVAHLETLEMHKAEIDTLEQENTKAQEELQNQELNLRDLQTQLREREKRFNDLYSEGLNFNFLKSK